MNVFDVYQHVANFRGGILIACTVKIALKNIVKIDMRKSIEATSNQKLFDQPVREDFPVDQGHSGFHFHILNCYDVENS